MDYQGVEIERLGHDTFKLAAGGLVIYFDPFELPGSDNQPADFIFISHHHFDHCSPEDLMKLISPKTVMLAGGLSTENLAPFKNQVKLLVMVRPGQNFNFGNLKVTTVPAYNLDKFRSPGALFHPRAENHLGYLAEIGGVSIYHAGDTDNIPEMSALTGRVEVALLPVSGKYVMTWQEAVECCKIIKSKLAVPMHYDKLVGSLSDAENFQKALGDFKIEVEII